MLEQQLEQATLFTDTTEDLLCSVAPHQTAARLLGSATTASATSITCRCDNNFECPSTTLAPGGDAIPPTSSSVLA